jgi:hypothetical protein
MNQTYDDESRRVRGTLLQTKGVWVITSALFVTAAIFDRQSRFLWLGAWALMTIFAVLIHSYAKGYLSKMRDRDSSPP